MKLRNAGVNPPLYLIIINVWLLKLMTEMVCLGRGVIYLLINQPHATLGIEMADFHCNTSWSTSIKGPVSAHLHGNE